MTLTLDSFHGLVAEVAVCIPQGINVLIAGFCYSVALHSCVEKSMHQTCPMCFEVLLLCTYFRTKIAPLDVGRLSCLTYFSNVLCNVLQ
jgi:hypothetical protein